MLLDDPGWFGEQGRRRTMTDEEREAWNKGRRDRTVEQKRMSKEALIALCREQSPTWQEAELEPWTISKQQLSPNVVGGRESRPKPWQEIAAEITVPALLATADTEKGAIVTPEIAQAAQTLNDLIQVALVEGVGHNIRREGLAVCMDAVKGFLAKQT